MNSAAGAAAIVVGAGQGRRMGADGNKVFLPLGGRPLLCHALETLATHPRVRQLIAVVAAGELEPFRRDVAPRLPAGISLRLRTGGGTRQASVWNGLQAVDPSLPLVLVHDGARPFLTHTLLEAVLIAAEAAGAAVPGVQVGDSLKRVDGDGLLVEGIDRGGVYRVQTPQGFRQPLLREALSAAARDGVRFADDAGAVTAYTSVRPRLVPGDRLNFKITTPEDLALARAVVKLNQPAG